MNQRNEEALFRGWELTHEGQVPWATGQPLEPAAYLRLSNNQYDKFCRQTGLGFCRLLRRSNIANRRSQFWSELRTLRCPRPIFRKCQDMTFLWNQPFALLNETGWRLEPLDAIYLWLTMCEGVGTNYRIWPTHRQLHWHIIKTNNWKIDGIRPGNQLLGNDNRSPRLFHIGLWLIGNGVRAMLVSQGTPDPIE